MSEHPANVGNPARRHETVDADVRGVIKFVIVLFAGLAAAIVGMRAYYNYLAAHQGLGPPATPFENTRPLPPPNVPRLLAVPHQELSQYLKQEQETLQTYGWVDRKSGVVRIPIDRAMDLLIQRGLTVEVSPPQGTLQPGTVPQYSEPKGYTPQ